MHAARRPRTHITKADTIVYRSSKSDCSACPMKHRCCPNTSIRKIARSVHEDARDGLPVDTLARVHIQRVPNFFAAPTALMPEERGMFRELRWWSIDEIAGSRETFIPRTLAGLLSPLLGDPWPAEPIVIVP